MKVKHHVDISKHIEPLLHSATGHKGSRRAHLLVVAVLVVVVVIVIISNLIQQ